MTKPEKKKPSVALFIFRAFLWLFLASLGYLVACKWIFPPITITQIVAVGQGYGIKRNYVSWNNISPNVKLAAIAAEDQLFPDHNGFDWHSLDKSLNKPKKKVVAGGGASTISQQTAKNVFLWQGSGYVRYARKGLEFIYTPLIEAIWGKQRILEVYLNVVEMGPGIFGIEAASNEYFHKSAAQLTRQEAATIIACLPNPKKYTVKPVSDYVLSRTGKILNQMRHIEGDVMVQRLTKGAMGGRSKS